MGEYGIIIFLWKHIHHGTFNLAQVVLFELCKASGCTITFAIDATTTEVLGSALYISVRAACTAYSRKSCSVVILARVLHCCFSALSVSVVFKIPIDTGRELNRNLFLLLVRMSLISLSINGVIRGPTLAKSRTISNVTQMLFSSIRTCKRIFSMTASFWIVT